MNYSATQMARKLDISRSYLYYLKENGVIKPEIDGDGKIVWTDTAYKQLKEYIRKNRSAEKVEKMEPPYKTTRINNRRYLGNKYKLLPWM